jgi:hypothetical protein
MRCDGNNGQREACNSGVALMSSCGGRHARVRRFIEEAI